MGGRSIKWLWGDCHGHSYWSDGLETIEEVTQTLILCEEDYHIQSDHLVIKLPEGKYIRFLGKQKLSSLSPYTYKKYVDECYQASSKRHLVIPASEISLRGKNKEEDEPYLQKHIVVMKPEGGSFPKSGWYKDKKWEEIVREFKRRGFAVLLAHAEGYRWYDTIDDMDINGFIIRYDIGARVPPPKHNIIEDGYWDRWLKNGKRIALAAGADFHQTDIWAGSGTRTVAWVEQVSRNSLRESIIKGKSYISATWHPDIYQEIGYKGAHSWSGGFTNWKNMTKYRDNREKAKPAVEAVKKRMFEENHGRVKSKKDFPTLLFTVNEKHIGEEVANTEKLAVRMEANMNLLIQYIKVIEGGRIVKVFYPKTPTFKNTFDYQTKVNTYLRVDIKGEDKQGHQEFLLSNPIWVIN